MEDRCGISGGHGASSSTGIKELVCVLDNIAISANFESHGHAASLVPKLQQ